MKQWWFIYREDRVAYCDPDFAWVNRIVIKEYTFSSNTTDWEIQEEAHSHEIKDLHEDHNTVSEGVLNRVLLRIVQVAREIQV